MTETLQNSTSQRISNLYDWATKRTSLTTWTLERRLNHNFLSKQNQIKCCGYPMHASVYSVCLSLLNLKNQTLRVCFHARKKEWIESQLMFALIMLFCLTIRFARRNQFFFLSSPSRKTVQTVTRRWLSTLKMVYFNPPKSIHKN